MFAKFRIYWIESNKNWVVNPDQFWADGWVRDNPARVSSGCHCEMFAVNRKLIFRFGNLSGKKI